MSVSKKYLKTKPVCKVTFRIPSNMANNANKAALTGDFNNWDVNALQMKKLKKDGSFSVTIDLEAGKEYKYRYLLDDNNWLNDEAADRYEFDHQVNTDNCIISL